MKFIDMHTHTYPDKVAERAIKSLASTIGRSDAYTNGTFEDTLVKMREWNIDAFAPLNIVTNPKNQSSATAYSASLKRDNVFPFGSIHPECGDIRAAARDIKEAGLYGIKLHPDYQMFHVDEPRVFPIYEACIEFNLPVVFHAGFDPYSPDEIHAPPEKLRAVANAFPTLQIIAAHLGGELMWNDVESYLVGLPNVWFDTAMLAGYVPENQAKRIIENHRRIVFGSDCPWHPSSVEVGFIRSLHLDAELEGDIFHRNAEKLLGL